jgi:hypothetical protein
MTSRSQDAPAEETLAPLGVRENYPDERLLRRQLYFGNEDEKRTPMTLNREPTSTREGGQGNLRCEHDYHPMLVVETRVGYYARCSGCLATGPERLSGEAARKALQVLGVRDATATMR